MDWQTVQDGLRRTLQPTSLLLLLTVLNLNLNLDRPAELLFRVDELICGMTTVFSSTIMIIIIISFPKSKEQISSSSNGERMIDGLASPSYWSSEKERNHQQIRRMEIITTCGSLSRCDWVVFLTGFHNRPSSVKSSGCRNDTESACIVSNGYILRVGQVYSYRFIQSVIRSLRVESSSEWCCPISRSTETVGNSEVSSDSHVQRILDDLVVGDHTYLYRLLFGFRSAVEIPVFWNATQRNQATSSHRSMYSYSFIHSQQANSWSSLSFCRTWRVVVCQRRVFD